MAALAGLADNGDAGALYRDRSDMSGRRRRDDEWDDGRLDAQDDQIGRASCRERVLNLV